MTTGRTSSIHLGFLIHNHQPVGNFPWVFQQVYTESYLPLLGALERHPGVRLSLHYTGSLLDWLEEAHPEFLERLKALVRRKQVEIVSGGYYEPILPSIPDTDKLAQIRRLTERIQTDFGMQATGMWLAERVWEPGLPHILQEAGIEWTILDDVHFKNVGLEDKDLYGYYTTEDNSGPLKVFATSQTLRYTVPFRPVGETIEALRALANLDGKRMVAMGDDGEKFGSWPDTFHYCWGHDGQSGWVDEFFKALEQNHEWLITTPLGEYARQESALGRIYIPTSSYIEMTEWSLPSHKAYQFGKLLHHLQDTKRTELLQFMRGGFWRNFLVRYPEVNNQHKKMLRIHDAVYSAGATEASGLVNLWKSQANDTYWHGLFGGVYMNHVRAAIYHHLLKAENAADQILMGEKPWQRYELTDFDRDGEPELLIESDQQNLYLDPRRGGGLFEWDMRRSEHNLTCVMTRREESYHQVLRDYEQAKRQRTHETSQADNQPISPHSMVRTKESNLDRYLVADPYRRQSLVDHFLEPGTTLTTFMQAQATEQADFIEQPYHPSIQQDEQGLTVILSRTGHLRRPGALSQLPLKLTKTLFLPLGQERLEVTYMLENLGQARIETRFGCEWNLNLLGGGGNEQAYYLIQGETPVTSHFDSTGETQGVQEIKIGNSWLQQEMEFKLSKPATLWRFSIDTVTGSEAGFERTHQGSSLTLLWPLTIEPGQTWSATILCQGREI